MDKTYFNDNKVSDHHALIPTTNQNTEKIYETLSENEKNFFDEIIASLIAIFYEEYEYGTTEIKISAQGKEFLCSGTMAIKPGFKKVYEVLKSQGKAATSGQDIPKLKEGETVSINAMEIREDRPNRLPSIIPEILLSLWKSIRLALLQLQ